MSNVQQTPPIKEKPRVSKRNGRKTKSVPMQPYAAELHYGNYVAAAMYMQGAFTTYDNPITRWNAVIHSPARFYKVRKRKKPPDKDPGKPLADYGARLRWLHKQNIHTYWQFPTILLLTLLTKLPTFRIFAGAIAHSPVKGATTRGRKMIIMNLQSHLIGRRVPNALWRKCSWTIPGYWWHFIMAITKCHRQPGSGTILGYWQHFMMAITKYHR